MKTAQKLGLTAALTFFSAISLPRAACAQGLTVPSATGTWSGVESYSTVDYLNGQIIGESSTTFASTLTLEFIFPYSDSFPLRSQRGCR